MSVVKRRPSMRLRVAASLAALALLVLLTQSVAMVVLLDDKEEEFIENQLSDQIAHSMAIWRQSPNAAFPNTPNMRLYRVEKDGGENPAGNEARSDLPPQFAGLKVGNHELYQGGKEFHIAVREDGNARYILAYDVENHESRLNSLLLLTIAASVMLGALTLFAGYLLAGRLTRRLERLAERVAADAPGPLVEPEMESEVQAVAEALDQYRERQSATLERERTFAANLSHELRTPLTGIRTDAEMLATLPDATEAIARRGNRIISSVDRINVLASSLLMLAREAKPGLPEEIRLQPAIESVWASLMLATPKPVGLRLEIPEASTLLADASLFELVMRNLLDNALRYSESGEVFCTLKSGNRLSVRDTGPGFAEGDLERIFDRFFIG
ncbi:MAG TPA: HAMP domain-containing sensor histidine kinase, partial [Azonexus sp.]|nr:HAMP domain-containing sensor histidine kinase [Azonexus sp.]